MLGTQHGCMSIYHITKTNGIKGSEIKPLKIHKHTYQCSPTFINYCFNLIKGYSVGIRLIWRATLSRHVHPRTRIQLRLLTVKAIHWAYLSGKTIRSASHTGNLCLFVLLSPILTVLHTHTEVSVGACEIRRAYHPKIKQEHKRIWRSHLQELAHCSIDASERGCCHGRISARNHTRRVSNVTGSHCVVSV